MRRAAPVHRRETRTGRPWSAAERPAAIGALADAAAILRGERGTRITAAAPAATAP
jgi:hypothetical protein